MSDLEVFRQETREWLEENCPQSMRSPVIDKRMSLYQSFRITETPSPIW